MNRLFVANKPKNISSNYFLSKIKKKYSYLNDGKKVKKAGFSGTLDPFASGTLIVAFGDYTKLFRFFKKTPKTYVATIWIGATSKSLDTQNITEIKNFLAFSMDSLNIIISSLVGKLKYTPPLYSAKHINGKRAYELARNGEEFELKEEIMEVYEAKILHYIHPFLTVELKVSEGSYIRSWAQLFAKKLGVSATLSALTRKSEGKFIYENEKELNPLDFLDLETNTYNGDSLDILNGKKLSKKDFLKQKNGKYLIKIDNLYSILEFEDEDIKYLVNRLSL